MRAILLSGGLAVICSLLGTRFAIGWFARHDFGQPIRDDGPTTQRLRPAAPTATEGRYRLGKPRSREH